MTNFGLIDFELGLYIKVNVKGGGWGRGEGGRGVEWPIWV